MFATRRTRIDARELYILEPEYAGRLRSCILESGGQLNNPGLRSEFLRKQWESEAVEIQAVFEAKARVAREAAKAHIMSTHESVI